MSPVIQHALDQVKASLETSATTLVGPGYILGEPIVKPVEASFTLPRTTEYLFNVPGNRYAKQWKGRKRTLSLAQRKYVRRLRIKDMRKALAQARMDKALAKLSRNAPPLLPNTLTKLKVTPFAPPTFAKLSTAKPVEDPCYGVMIDKSKEYEKLPDGSIAVPSAPTIAELFA